MLAGNLIRRAVLLIVVVAGLALVADALAAELKADHKATARVPPAPERSKGIPLSSYDICLPGEDKSAAGPTELLLLPDDGICLPGDDKTAPAAKAHPKRAHDRHRGQGHSAPAAEAPRTIINVGGGTMILTGSGGNITITVETEGHPAQQPTAGGPAAEPPHELAMRPLPPYRIEPPDVLQIDLPTLVPLPPYRAAFYDVLTIHVSNALTDQPIDNYFRVEASGVVNLGPAYGSVRVKGMTLEQIKKAVEKKLDPVVREPEVSVQLAQVFGAQPISGQYWVGPDGTINLRKYGLFQVRGMTIPEAQAALEKHLSKYLVAPELSVEVVGHNSKSYYIITEGAELGDNLRRFSITGNETVLDAISQVNGLSQVSTRKIWIARPSAADPKKGTILPVDWEAITRRGATATNYQVLPGDRIFIGEDRLVAWNNRLNKEAAPLERVLGVIGLIESTIRGLLPQP